MKTVVIHEHGGVDKLRYEAMPHILDSAGSGVVAEVGSGVRSVGVGDKVLLAPGWGCGSC